MPIPPPKLINSNLMPNLVAISAAKSKTILAFNNKPNVDLNINSIDLYTKNN